MRETIKQGDRGTSVRVLQSHLNALGTNLVVDGEFGEATDEAVRDFQAYQGIVEDGIVGPKTWKQLDDALYRKRCMDDLARTDKLEAAGKKAVERALAIWALDIYDPKPWDKTPDAKRCKTAIDEFIRLGIAWYWQDTYEGDGDFEWCLAFVSTCWIDLAESLRVVYGASTYRWDRFGGYRSAFGEKNEGTGRLYMKCDEHTKVEDLPWEPRPGDIALVGKTGYGTHGVLIERFDKENGCVDTIEGNASGEGPHGEHQNGVVKSTRFFGGHTKGGTHIRRIIRPSVDDLK